MIIKKVSVVQTGRKIQILMLKFALGAIIGFAITAGLFSLLATFFEDSLAQYESIWSLVFMLLFLTLILGCGIASVKIINKILNKRNKELS